MKTLLVNEDVTLHTFLSILTSTTDEMNTEIQVYRNKLSLKSMHEHMQVCGLKFYERHQNFQNKIHCMMHNQRRHMKCLQLVCLQFNKLINSLQNNYTNCEILIVSKCTLISDLYKNMIKIYFRTASHQLLHTTCS